MADINDFRGTKVGSHIIDCVEMLDFETCILSFEAEQEGTDFVDSQAEYWIDENSWHFNDVWFDKDGSYTETKKTERLTEEEQKQCKEIIKEYLKQF